MVKLLLRGCLLLLLLTLAACGRANIFTPTPRPTATQIPIFQQATDTARATADATVNATLPPTANAGDPVGDPARGQALFNEVQPSIGFACANCHDPTSEARIVGPGLKGVKARAEARVQGEGGAVFMLRLSIVNPNAYIAPGDPPFQPNVMPQVYSQIFTKDQINDLIAYLVTL